MEFKFAEFFAGTACGSRAIKKVIPNAKCAFYSEIEKNRVKLLQLTHPGVMNIGDIDFMETENLPKGLDLAIAGSPCQNLSIANTQTREGLDGHESGLFYKYCEYLEDNKPKYFILENVASMAKSERDEITRKLTKINNGRPVNPIEINSLYFTGQARKRLYWCNFPILSTPNASIDPRHCIDKSVLPDRPTSDFINIDELYSAYTPNGRMKDPKSLHNGKSDWDFVAWSRSTRYKWFDGGYLYDFWKDQNKGLKHKIINDNASGIKISYVEQRIKINLQANTLLTGNGCSIFSSRNFIRHGDKMRLLTPLECARLQGLPDGLFNDWPDSAAYAAIGDGFTLNVIEHLIKSLKMHIDGVKY